MQKNESLWLQQLNLSLINDLLSFNHSMNLHFTNLCRDQARRFAFLIEKSVVDTKNACTSRIVNNTNRENAQR